MAPLLLAFALWAGFASAAEPPGTNRPFDGDCGFPAGTDLKAAEAGLVETYLAVLRAARFTWTPDLAYVPGLSESGLQAVPPREPENPGPLPVVEFGPVLCETARSRDEVGFAFAHELAHIALGHFAARTAEIDRLFDEWSAGRDRSLDPDEEFERFRTFADPQLHALERAEETEADLQAYRWLSAPDSGFDARAGADYFRHAQDRRWAVGLTRPDSTHPPALERAAAIEEAAGR